MTSVKITSCGYCHGELLPAFVREASDIWFGWPGQADYSRCADCGSVVRCEQRGAAEHADGGYYTHDQMPLPARIRTRVALYSARPLVSGVLSKTSRSGSRFFESWMRVSGPAVALPVLGPGAGRSLLDVGCGSGDALKIYRAAGYRTVGLEPDPQAVQGCSGAIVGLLDAVRAGSFDVVTTSHVIEHTPSPLTFVEECWRVLKPGGTLVQIAPNAASPLCDAFGRNWRGLEPLRHVCIPTPRGFESSLRSAGFSDVSVSTLNRADKSLLALSQLRAGDEVVSVPAPPFQSEVLAIARKAPSS